MFFTIIQIVTDMPPKKVTQSSVAPLRLVDLFAGTGAFTHAFQSTGKVKCVFANDMVPASEAIYNENFGTEHKLTLKNLHDVTVEEIPPHDILTGGFPCFVAGTRVLTNSGYKTIETVELTDRLMTHTGKFQAIVNTQKKNSAISIYAIDIKYHPHDIQCTEEHPFYVRERTKLWDNSIRRYIFQFGKPEWTPASKLSPEHFVGMPVDSQSIIPSITVPIKVNQTVEKDTNMTLDNKDQWFMMGYFLGDGWIEETKKSDGRDTNKIRFAINNKDEGYVLSRISKVLNITDKSCPTGQCKKFGCANITWFTILKEFGKYAHGKKIPEWVQSAPVDLIQEFLLGYQTADGYDANTYIQYTTISDNIAYGIQRLYLKLGKLCSVTYHRMPETCIIEGHTVNQRCNYKMRVFQNNECEQSSFVQDNYAWFKISKVSSSTTEPQTVYNFEVANDNSYCVENTIVHNCQPFSIAGHQKGFEDERSNVFFKILAILDKHNPRCVILENVKNLLTHGLTKTPKKLKEGDPGYVKVPKKGETGYVAPARKPRKGEMGYIEKSTFGPTFQRIKTELENRGYHLQYKVLNTAKITTVPQHRERIYIVCIKNKAIADRFNLDFPTVTKATIGSLLSADAIPEKYYYTEEKNNKTSARKPKEEENTLVPEGEEEPVDEESEDIDEETAENADNEAPNKEKKTVWQLVKDSITKENTVYQYRRVYVRENKNNDCPTLTANMGSGGHNVPLIKDKTGIRKLTPRECFNFQGFPTTYKLPALSDSHLYKLAGNAVSVPVVKLIAERLVPLLSP